MGWEEKVRTGLIARDGGGGGRWGREERTFIVDPYRRALYRFHCKDSEDCLHGPSSTKQMTNGT